MQGYLLHEKECPFRTPQGSTVGPRGGSLSHKRGTPIDNVFPFMCDYFANGSPFYSQGFGAVRAVDNMWMVYVLACMHGVHP